MDKNLTFIVPAAGKSKRFKSKERKIFYIYKKKTLIEHIINKIKKFSNNIILISNKEDYKKIKLITKKYNDLKIKIFIQNKPKGMGDAIKIGLSKVKTIFSAVIWADQIFLSKGTIKKTILEFEAKKPLLCFPVIIKKYPYVYINYKKNYFFNIVQTREGGKVIKKGYSDCGFFIFETQQIYKILKNLIRLKKIITKKTKEIDFLKSFTYIKKFGNILTVKALFIKDSVGINYLEDLK